MRQRATAAAILAVAAVTTAGCGSSGGGDSQPTEHQLLQQTRATLQRELHPVASGLFNVPAGTCTIQVIATGADAQVYEGYPWTVESPDGEVAIKVGSGDGALTEDCNGAIREAMGW